jgi:hypothetical protein
MRTWKREQGFDGRLIKEKIVTVNDLDAVQDSLAYAIPTDYIPRTDFKSPNEIAQVLGLSDSTKYFTLPISSDAVDNIEKMVAAAESPEDVPLAIARITEDDLRQYVAHKGTVNQSTIEQPRKDNRKPPPPKHFTSKDKTSLRASYIVSTPACLYTLQQFLNNAAPGSKAGYCDGTHNTSFDGNILMILGVCDVGYRRCAGFMSYSRSRRRIQLDEVGPKTMVVALFISYMTKRMPKQSASTSPWHTSRRLQQLPN